jgi:hypothetical protein
VFFPQLQSFFKTIYSNQMSRLGWKSKPNEASGTGTLRATVISMMGISGDKVVMKQAFDAFMAYRKDPVGAPIAGDLQHAIFRCALRHDEATVQKALRDIYEDSRTSPESKRNCLIVMGCVKDLQHHADVMDYLFWSGQVRLQDFAFPLGSLSGTTDEGGVAVWEYFQKHHSKLHDRLGDGNWGGCVALSCRGVTTTEKADEIEAFFADPSHPVGSAKRRLEQALEVVRTRIDRRERDREGVAKYFSNL